MKEKIVLKNGKEYPLIIDGVLHNKSSVTLRFQTDETLENLTAVFSDPANTEQIRIVNGDDGVLSVYDGYTELDNPKAVDDHCLITPEQYGEDGQISAEAVYGRVAMLTLTQPSVTEQVGKNRADIDFLALITGTEL